MSVVRSGDATLEEVLQQYPNVSHLVISPGPGHPLKDSGISIPAIKHYAGKLPILGVCMGLQCMFAAYGGTVDRVGEIVHGKTSVLKHDAKGIFHGVRPDINGTRYHSLAGTLGTLPEELEVTCRTARLGQEGSIETNGIVMGIRHKTLTLEAVQYHPESILSDEGQVMLANFLKLQGGTWDENPGYGLSASERAPTNGKPAEAEATKTTSNGKSGPTILDRIYEQRRKDVEKAKATPGSYPSDLTAFIDLDLAPPQISFYDRLLPTSISSTAGDSTSVALMAEVKRASPSKGDILSPTSPLTSASIGYAYAQAGASVISVLTEPTWFKGTLNDMLAVRRVVSNMVHRPAILRKDFIFDTYQIDEARYYGADTVLLIVAMLDDATLKHLYDYARYVRGMEPLVEINNPAELERALNIGAKVIGVNNRNLHDFNVDMGTTSRIAEVITERQRQYQESAVGGGIIDDRKVILCALSGITGREDVVKYTEQGVGAVLVGEALMRSDDKPAFVRHLLGISDPAASASYTRQRTSSQISITKPKLTGPPDALGEPVETDAAVDTSDSNGQASSLAKYRPLVKICGIQSAEAALTAAESGADFIGLIFVPKSKRYVDIKQAKQIIDQVRQGKASAAAEKTPASSDYFAQQASRLASNPRKPLFVGVFQNATFETVQQTVDALSLDVVQLHGSEPAEWCQLLKVPTFRAFHVDEGLREGDLASSHATMLALREAARPGYHSIPLLDTKVSKAANGLSGGAGKVFDWQVASKLVSEDAPGLPILLAGGLDVTNVRKALDLVRPWAIDISGGVETNGEKDLEKIRAFIKIAKA